MASHPAEPAQQQNFPQLAELEPPRHAEDGRSAVSAAFTSSIAADVLPALAHVTTLFELFWNSAQKYQMQPCLGFRRIIDDVAQPFEFMTYMEVASRVAATASGFRALGVQRHDKVGILGVNCPQWMFAMQACNRLNLACVPLYETLGETAIEFIINHAETRVVIVQADRLQRLADTLPTINTKLLAVVYWGEPPETAIKAIKAAGARLLSFSELEALGGQSPVEADPPAPTDVCTIMYTSGTTGDPKGVMLSHGAIVATIAACDTYLASFNEHVGCGDQYLSYLPLAHIFDRMMEEFCLVKGCAIGYFQGRIDRLPEDIAALRPTIFAGVPRVFDRVHQGVQKQVHANRVRPHIFGAAMKRKKHLMQLGYRHDKATPFLDWLIFSKVKKRLGGRLRLIISGAAPLAAHVEEAMMLTMCCPLVQGYGLTETCAASFISEPFQWDQIGTVGPPLPGVQFRLEAVPEMEYDPLGSPPRGEVCIRGSTLFSGYYKAPELTQDCMDDEGWFHTGDIGEIIGRGSLRIIDRRKNIFKLAQGEYVAVEKLENVYKSCGLVEQVWVYGNSFESVLVAVVVPERSKLMDWAAKQGLAGGYEDIVAMPGAKAHLLQLLQGIGRSAGLRGFELIKALHLEAHEFSVENGLMTPTFKLKRAPLLKHYQQEVDAMYAQVNAAQEK